MSKLFFKSPIDFLLEIPPDKPPPLKYHLYVKDVATSIEGASEESEDEINDLDTTFDEKQHIHHQQQQSSILLTTECHVVAPGAAIPGTLAVTNDSLYYTADEDSEEIKKIDPQVVVLFLTVLFKIQNAISNV